MTDKLKPSDPTNEVKPAPLPQFLAISEALRTQDNLATADPLWVVFDRIRKYGLDPQWSDENVVWIDGANDNQEATAEEVKELEAGGDTGDWIRTGYWIEEKFVTACFTKDAAEQYIKTNRHHFKDPFVYAASLYRNPEMISIRNFLLAAPSPETSREPGDGSGGHTHKEGQVTLSLNDAGDFGAGGVRPLCGDVEGTDKIGISNKAARTRKG